jgi:hypothetical protein
MSRVGIEQLLFLLDEAFEGHGEHSLLGNLKSLAPDNWHWLPPAGKRSIFEIARHVGECKYVYDSHAFGDGSMRWDRPGSIPTVEVNASAEDVVAWLRAGHRRLCASVDALADDGELLRKRRANWGESYQTRWLINVMVQHDLYHAGEINHIRALCHGDDRWPEYVDGN